MRLGTGVMQGLGQIMGEIFTPLDFNKDRPPSTNPAITPP